jgi:ligand-binding sensor domain-containing protein
MKQIKLSTLVLFFILILFCNYGISQSIEIENYTAPGGINTLFAENDTIWIGTNSGGVYKRSINGDILAIYSTENGLASNTITDILIDNTGRKWFSHGWTYAFGISILDGNSWQYFTIDDGLGDNWINSLAMDLDGNIWATTNEGGVSVYKNKEWKTYSESDGLYDNRAEKIVIDNNNNIWVSHIYGLSKYDGISWTSFEFSNGVTDIELSENRLWILSNKLYYYDSNSFKDTINLPGIGIYDLQFNQNNHIYLGTTEGVYKYETDNWVLLSNTYEGLFQDTEKVIFDKNSNLWAGVNSELHFYDNENWKIFYVLKNDCIEDIDIDNLGNKWLATFSGISKFNDTTWINYYEPKDSLIDNATNCIKVDTLNNIWIGTTVGLSKFNCVDWKNFKFGYINDIEIDNQGKIWVGSRDSGLYNFIDTLFVKYTVEDGLIDNSINDIEIDNQGNIWIGTGKGASKYNGELWENYSWDEGLKASSVYTIGIDKTNRKWFGTSGGLLFIYDDVNWESIMVGIHIIDIEFDTLGNAWFGTLSGGLFMYNEGVLLEFSEDDGLLGNHVYDVEIDNDGYLWLATRYALSKVKYNDEPLKIIYDKNNIPNEYKVYPNPVTDLLFIESRKNTRNDVYIKVIDVTGKIVITSTLKKNKNIVSLDLSHLSKGIYIVRLELQDLFTNTFSIIKK